MIRNSLKVNQEDGCRAVPVGDRDDGHCSEFQPDSNGGLLLEKAIPRATCYRDNTQPARKLA